MFVPTLPATHCLTRRVAHLVKKVLRAVPATQAFQIIRTKSFAKKFQGLASTEAISCQEVKKPKQPS